MVRQVDVGMSSRREDESGRTVQRRRTRAFAVAKQRHVCLRAEAPGTADRTGSTSRQPVGARRGLVRVGCDDEPRNGDSGTPAPSGDRQGVLESSVSNAEALWHAFAAARGHCVVDEPEWLVVDAGRDVGGTRVILRRAVVGGA